MYKPSVPKAYYYVSFLRLHFEVQQQTGGPDGERRAGDALNTLECEHKWGCLSERRELRTKKHRCPQMFEKVTQQSSQSVKPGPKYRMQNDRGIIKFSQRSFTHQGPSLALARHRNNPCNKQCTWSYPFVKFAK